MATKTKRNRAVDLPRSCSAWGCLWRSKNALDGLNEHLLYDGPVPALFRDRAAARAHIKSKYGYILRRPDLRAEPHGWLLPVAVRVEVRVKPNACLSHGEGGKKS